jgi:hypothetical protein
MRIKLFIAFLGLLFTTSLWAQETTSEIRGIITGDGKALAGATITAIHTPTNTKYVTSSRSDGRYNLPNVRVGGPYSITCSFVSYKTDKQEGIMLSLGQEYTANFSLVPNATVGTGVVVVGSRQDKVFSNSRTGSQEVVNRSQIERLPTISRSLTDYTKLAPSSNGLSFGGVSSAYNNLTVDGANFNNVFGLSGTLGGQTNSQPISIDAIEQIQVSINPYDVRQGSFAGAGINSVTRSGTNRIKGSVYYFTRNENTQGYKVNNTVAVKTPIEYGQFGANIGAPIIKDKLFIFASYEQEKIDLPGSPTWRAARPGETPNGTSISQARTADLDALKTFLISKYNYNPGVYDNYNYRTESKKATVRLDYNLNSRNTITLKYNFLRSLRDIAASNSGAQGSRQPSATGMPFNGNGYTINNNFDILIAELNTKFSNKMNNKLQIGYSALRDFRESLSGQLFPLIDILNGQGQTLTSFGYEPFTFNNKLNSDVFQFSDIFTLYKGSHEITIGTQNYYKEFVNGFAPNYVGYYRFNNLADFYTAANNPYTGPGTPGSTTATLRRLSYASTKDGAFPFATVGALELGFFAQDKWRILPNLTVTAGLRADIPIFNNDFTRNDSLTALTFQNGIKVNTGAAPNTQVLWSPRVGFNWDVNNDKKTQIRGGFGVFSGPPPFVWISNQAGNNGVQFGSFVLGDGTTANQPFSPDINTFRPGGGALSSSYNIAVIDKDFKYPQIFKVSLAVDRKLGDNWTLTLEGNYNKDINSVYFQNINLSNSAQPLQGMDNRVRFSAPQIYAGTGGATLSNPNISDVILMRNSNKGYGYFITAQLQKASKNFSGSIAYTYSRARTVNDGGSIAQSNWRDRPAINPNAEEMGFANFYQPHRVVAYGIWRKEYAKHFATSIGATFEAATAGNTSYAYNGDLNNDNAGGNNDLMYIPRNASEVVLVKSSAADPRTPAQMWAQLDNYINQDNYLSQRRGQYAERGAALLPYYKRLNVNITQDFFYTTKDKTRHTLRLTFDIFNVGNLLNKQWGVTKAFNNTAPLRFVGLAPDGKPMLTFPYLDNANQVPLVNSYTDNTGIVSRWQMQIGIRYLFN